MIGTESMSERVVAALLEAGLVTSGQMAAVSEAASGSGATPGRVLLERGLVDLDALMGVLERDLGMPRVDLTSYVPDEAALASVPAETAREWTMLPLFEIDGILTVALGDPTDVFDLDTLSASLGVEVEAVIGEPSSITEALGHYYGPPAPEAGEGAPAEPMAADQSGAEPAEAPAAVGSAPDDADTASAAEMLPEHAEPAGAIDLDVLAVADPAKVTGLVVRIIEDALGRGASHVHLLPYKDEFFLVYRVDGRLEQIASAPLSLQHSLVDAIASYVRLDRTPGALPALGRSRTRAGERERTLTVSIVPTLGGERLVIEFGTPGDAPRELEALGMSEAEARALRAMVERGRGLMLVCAPVAGGRSETYYALLAHAAGAGKTVYSVERAAGYEMPAVAQALVSPGSAGGAAAYLAAGLAQDTDVIGIDSLHSAEEAHLAIEAGARGRLVIATVAADGIVSGVRRLLELGTEPSSLAATLAFGVAQRLVRVNCPACTDAERNPLAAEIPGAPSGIVSRAGSGCPACGKSGYAGMTGIFEVLPFTEPVRAVVAGGAGADELVAAVAAAGMRPMVASGLAKVEQGLLSAHELNRVVRFTG